MPRSDYRQCRACGKSSQDVGSLSHTRLCALCSEELLRRNVMGIAAQAGPEYTRWRRGMVAWVVDAILDEPPPMLQSGDHAA